MIYVVEHFVPEEFFCPCCHRGQVSAALVYALDELRRMWGAPIRVNSGFRCPNHNAEVGGAQKSRHMLGCAADIAPVDPLLIAPFHTLIGSYACWRKSWEMKFYPRFVHLAVPRTEAAHIWTGGSISATFTPGAGA